MGHYGNDGMWLMWPWMLGWSVLLLAALAALIWAIVRLARGGGEGPGSARRILDERYARGEIDDDEYRKRRETLR
ncbi:SHOCT domain-containing protein [Arthrobacter sp. QXT-31]|uniref:SHOCT domain-containing protein n=1 Tax=Arthrobacter sp. QXT-31 TaxID=1357915 RepID=UPI0009F91FF7|nr:SHOCT domain-containing protein [Arthrobacter sp. QXT-31]